MLKEPTNGSWVCVGHQVSGWLVALCVLGGAGCAAGHSRLDRLAWEQSRLIDLTHSFGADTIVWLASEAPQDLTGKFLRDRKEIAW